MKKPTKPGFVRAALLALPVLLALVACGKAPKAKEEATHDSLPSDYTEQATQWADSVASTLSVKQKAGMVFMPAVFTNTEPVNIASIRSYAVDKRVGGLILLKGDSQSARVIADSLRAWGRQDMFMAIDAEWGLAMRFSDAREYPANGEWPDATTEEEMFDYGAAVGAQAIERGINMVLGPVVDVLPASGRSAIGKRSFGSDPGRVGRLATAYVKGVRSRGVVAVGKHFPGLGSLLADSHKITPILNRSLAMLDSIDLAPFRTAIDQGLSAVMVGHVCVAALDPDGRPASVSESVIDGLLRSKLGFKGLVITDALNMGGASGASPVDAVMAGADMVAAPVDTDRAISDIENAVADGSMPIGVLDDRVRRILFHLYPFVK